MWYVKLVQASNPEWPRYYAESNRGKLNVTLKHCSTYSTEAAAQAQIAKLQPHPWGVWRAVEINADKPSTVDIFS